MLSKETKLANILAFCVLMQDLEQHSPDYIREKFARYCMSEDEEWRWGIDQKNMFRLLDYMEKWKIREQIINQSDNDNDNKNKV